MIGVDDLLALEELEDARDLAAFREAARNDDGQRVSLATCALNSTTSDVSLVALLASRSWIDGRGACIELIGASGSA